MVLVRLRSEDGAHQQHPARLAVPGIGGSLKAGIDQLRNAFLPPPQPWSFTGHKTHLEGHDVPQPDNAEFDINESVEACMGILNDIYEDGVKWHDIACYHTKPYVCEDSDQLLDYVAATDPEVLLDVPEGTIRRDELPEEGELPEEVGVVASVGGAAVRGGRQA